MLVDRFYEDLGVTAEAVVAMDLREPADFAELTGVWATHFGPPESLTRSTAITNRL